ncbi:GP46-like surface antigen, putative [Bodo saltans]|uniref:GP46-like surface antigen, putative n=1 Tax=Bodo saltans TaxID=75058 RepID=A0A0S4KL26_BODSA|nr:GP46-like surface antigen, putative [Bodo saltans]|eukprot:CUI15063.1 GP46-like surface antigen, putative [Bodo saltans]
MLTSRGFSIYSPTGSVQLPPGAVAGYSMSLSSSTVTFASPSTAGITYLSVSNSVVPDISGMLNITSIYISSGTLGTISWTSMLRLTSITIASSPSITGALPETWTNSHFPALTSIYLSSLGVTSIPSAAWSSITMLTSITIESCSSLTSALPSEWSSLNQLYSISISGTPFLGPLPDSWSYLASVVTISISGAQFSGTTFPASWVASGSMPNLVSLVIVSCGLGGALPSQWEGTAPLTYLGLSSNSIIGPLPTTVTGWSRLTTLDLSSNFIGTVLPDWSLSSLTTFSCNSCGISGPLPQWGYMPNINTIFLSSNPIGSSIPYSWSQSLQHLGALNLASSSITGQLPVTWTSTFLSTLSLGSTCP